MGVDIKCKKTGRSLTLGYGGFARWRMKIAELYSPIWYAHYSKLLTESPRHNMAQWFEAFDRETERLLEEEHLNVKIVDFCMQPDTRGDVNYGACKDILKAIGNYSDNCAYTYAAHADHDWDRLKQILQDCVDTKSKLVWD